ncbi:nicotinate-nucleotide adenylyltransferase [Methylobacterium frigidaeris]|uniref:Probable nicotinate-nucleotide adenylyltransferase n=1 Tax=Methylobacterium frigidaeris TaxID=2038277 RepID=A0AA37M5Y9_9HYPH|nr:nicotinate-nucleotide adenylyltransferase [Methylobacterium frigidaeris]PIK69909.1 nicotinic acid mononucleotide adenylyltransferase [Methylobacterium frigidaeris]GJD63910.1 nicotinate-nucleotide adenylyltransferase [Methylobacterium frigidaeris]
MIVRLPPLAPGLRVGLYGGSFNPAHAGHRHVSRLALRRLALDRVWWLVSPGNPLKDRSHLPDAASRAEGARAVARDPRIAVTDFEAALEVRYTVETLSWLTDRHPEIRFVWIMGADSLASFHRWRGWREIAARMPFAVIDRPGYTLRAMASPAARALAASRIDEPAAATLADRRPPAWVFLHGPRNSLSSTALRAVTIRSAS